MRHSCLKSGRATDQALRDTPRLAGMAASRRSIRYLRMGAALLEGRVLGILKAPAPREELPRAEPRQMPEE